MRRLTGRSIPSVAVLTIAVSMLFSIATVDSLAQRPSRPRPPRVQGDTPIGTINGQPVTANDLITTINTDSPFMPPLDGSPAPTLQQFENQYPANVPPN